MDRRAFLGRFLGGVMAAWALSGTAEAGPFRRRRRRERRRVRRRIRRRVAFRMMTGRRWWVVPTACAAGWELATPHRVVVVKEVHIVEESGNKVEMAVVEDAGGKTEEVPLVREDTKENAEELEGSVLPDDDKTTPAIEREEEVEVGDDGKGAKEKASSKEMEDKPKAKSR